jgi:hypothetical protein
MQQSAPCQPRFNPRTHMECDESILARRQTNDGFNPRTPFSGDWQPFGSANAPTITQYANYISSNH